MGVHDQQFEPRRLETFKSLEQPGREAEFLIVREKRVNKKVCDTGMDAGKSKIIRESEEFRESSGKGCTSKHPV
jgi:hypothetical protein